MSIYSTSGIEYKEMAIITDYEAVRGESSPEQMKIINDIAAAMVGSCTKFGPETVGANVFLFAQRFVATLANAKKQEVQALRNGQRPEAVIERLVEFSQGEEDNKNDLGVQTFLGRFSRSTNTELTNYDQKGQAYSAELTSYALHIGGIAVEVLRMQQLNNPEEPISYTLTTLGPSSEYDS